MSTAESESAGGFMRILVFEPLKEAVCEGILRMISTPCRKLWAAASSPYISNQRQDALVLVQ